MKISIEDEASPADALAVERGLIAHATTQGIEPRNYRSLAIVLRDDAGVVTGGLIAATVWGWLHVKGTLGRRSVPRSALGCEADGTG